VGEIKIIAETQIETFTGPGLKAKQQVITYQVEGLAPRTVWVDSTTLPDITWRAKNPGKPVPVDVQAAGDKVRRSLIEAEISKISKAPGPRSI
jgi:hypothetical protein